MCTAKPPKSNITNDERRALCQLRELDDIVTALLSVQTCWGNDKKNWGFMDFLKSTRLVCSIGSVTYNLVKFLIKKLSPLVGKCEHHVKNSSESIHIIQEPSIGQNDIMVSFDVVSLFMSPHQLHHEPSKWKSSPVPDWDLSTCIEHNIFSIKLRLLWTEDSFGISIVSSYSKLLHEAFWKSGFRECTTKTSHVFTVMWMTHLPSGHMAQKNWRYFSSILMAFTT